ncbi:hypothetical protein BDL97_13G030600 [Sphagnum fallax]|nr:hypothetical protein BDL97_13G030600 [Sphagnum fallax]
MNNCLRKQAAASFLLCCTTHFLLLEHSILVLSLFTRRAVRSAFKRCNKERRDKNSNSVTQFPTENITIQFVSG